MAARHPCCVVQFCAVITCSMTRDEYELRRQRLDEQLRAGIELLQTAHRQQVRALDLVWATTAEGDFEIPQFEPRPAATQPISSPQQAPARPSRQRAGQLYNDIQDVLPRLPEVFDRNHVLAQLWLRAGSRLATSDAPGAHRRRRHLPRSLRSRQDAFALPEEERGQQRSNAVMSPPRCGLSPFGIATRRNPHVTCRSAATTQSAAGGIARSRIEAQRSARRAPMNGAAIRESVREARRSRAATRRTRGGTWPSPTGILPSRIESFPSRGEYRSSAGACCPPRGVCLNSRGEVSPSRGECHNCAGECRPSRGEYRNSRGEDSPLAGGIAIPQGRAASPGLAVSVSEGDLAHRDACEVDRRGQDIPRRQRDARARGLCRSGESAFTNR